MPTLLIDQETTEEQHVGTLHLDIGLAVAVLDDHRYELLTKRLRQATFSEDRNDDGKLTRQRWKIEGPPKVTVDFLISPTRADDKPGTLRHIEADFAAIIAPGLHLAFEDRIRVQLDGRTIVGERARREVWVAGPGAFVVLKALAFESRGENEDVYDLFYVLKNFGSDVDDVVKRLQPLLEDPYAQRALEILERDFADIDGVGPRRIATSASVAGTGTGTASALVAGIGMAHRKVRAAWGQPTLPYW